ncbi:MAG: DUF1553 domain-containing protein [Acidobacteriota bacterium]|nr:DUF1553 domain-containing protein [Acidobacteriota bacterium]
MSAILPTGLVFRQVPAAVVAVLAGVALLSAPPSGSAGDEAPVDFQSQVRPILSDSCFECHGPDPKARLADLRLDLEEGVFSQRPAGSPVAPGDPESSLVYQRITHPDAALRMPPKYAHKELTEDQIQVVRRWIEEGAPWEEHWSFAPLTRPPLPQVQSPEWVRNPIDRFVLARLEKEGLTPAREADRRTLARRTSLDLTGLPPLPHEVEQFVADASSDAYSRWVDGRMRSAAYGEHRGRYWLDAARYGDTHGLHIDNYREMWAYRDWVIRAFNRNLPFDQFTVEQLAGDLLPDPTPEQLVATGFHRCNITTNEGGVIKEEVEVMYAKDRVDTTGTVWLGLTVGCATCHDHKFDPITQKDFYSLAAFFRNTTQKPLDGNAFDPPPVMIVPARSDAIRWEELRQEEPAAREKRDQIEQAADEEFRRWLDSDRHLDLDLDEFDGSQVFSLELGETPHLRAGSEKRELALSGSSRIDRSGAVPSLELPDESYLEIEDFPGLEADRPFTLSVTFRFWKGGSRMMLARQVDPDNENRGWSLEISGDRPSLNLQVKDGRNMGIRGVEENKLVPDQWHNVIVTYDGLRQRTGMNLYLDGTVVPTQSFGRAIRVLEGSIKNSTPLVLGAGDRPSAGKFDFLNGSIRQFRILNRSVGESEARLLAQWDSLTALRKQDAAKPNAVDREALRAYFLVRRHAEFGEVARHLKSLQDERRAILRGSSLTHVMRENAESDPMAHILRRGMYDQRGDEVQPATPGVLPAMDPDLPRNRLGLARWLVSDDNPLTSRVMVNRFWQEVFGTGLVRTSEDFGSQGEAPTHPELLDWLAVEFRDSGWDVKHLFGLMLDSATYRQSARATDEKVKKDPGNRLFSRGPRFRMDGEMVRDYALAASGLLERRIGGRSVKTYQPEGLWEAVAMEGSNTRFYKQDSGSDIYRRSLYTFWKRAAPPPQLVVFNAPTREECTVRRERTNTPLQALLTLNGVQFFEAARHLAQRAMQAAPGADQRLDFMASHLLARSLHEAEQEVARKAFSDYLSYYGDHPDQAGKALSVGDSEADESLPKAEFAAWTMVANQLMNLDEVLNK